MSRGISIADIDLSKCGPNSPLHALAKKKRAPSAKKEQRIQVALFAWTEAAVAEYPELALLFAIPNAGGFTGGFEKNMLRVLAMRREGVKKGVLDVCLPVARGPYHALYLELKAEKGKTKPEQRWWVEQLTAQGNLAVVCNTFDGARDQLLTYLNL